MGVVVGISFTPTTAMPIRNFRPHKLQQESKELVQDLSFLGAGTEVPPSSALEIRVNAVLRRKETPGQLAASSFPHSTVALSQVCSMWCLKTFEKKLSQNEKHSRQVEILLPNLHPLTRCFAFLNFGENLACPLIDFFLLQGFL